MTDAQIQHESFTYTSEIDRLCKQNLKNLNNIINKLHLMPLKKKKREHAHCLQTLMEYLQKLNISQKKYLKFKKLLKAEIIV